MRHRDDLSICRDQVVLLRAAVDVVDAFEQRDPLDAGLVECVMEEAHHAAAVVAQNTIPGNARVHHADVRGGLVLLQPRGENGGPFAVGVERGLVAVGDGIAEGHNGSGIGGRDDVHAGEIVIRLGDSGRVRDGGLRGEVAFLRDVGRVQREAVVGLGAGLFGKVEAHGEVGECWYRERDRIADDGFAGVDRGRRPAAESEGPVGARHCGRVFGANGNVRRAQRYRGASHCVRKADAYFSAAKAGPNDHAHGLVVQSQKRRRNGEAALRSAGREWRGLRARDDAGRRAGCAPTAARATGDSELFRRSPGGNPVLGGWRGRQREGAGEGKSGEISCGRCHEFGRK